VKIIRRNPVTAGLWAASLLATGLALTTSSGGCFLIPLFMAGDMLMDLGSGAKSLYESTKDIPPIDEYEYGKASLAQILSEPSSKLYRKNPTLNNYVNAIGQTLAAVSDRPDVYGGWHFGVIESDEINAFAAPGGFVVVTTGCIKACKNEDQLAGVLAHEVAHVELHHAAASVKKAKQAAAAEKIGGVAVNVGASQMNTGGLPVGEVAGFIIPMLSKQIVNGYNRDLESDADTRAVELLAATGYNPHEMGEFFKAMKAPKQGTLDKLLKPSTHYDPQTRATGVAAKIAALESKGKKFATDPARTSRFAGFAKL
jgi:predicted Zn-dependent protease